MGQEDDWLGRLRHLVLPLVTLVAAHAASLALYTRTAMIDALTADYARTARMMGCPEARVIWTRALPAAALPIATMAGLQLAHFLEGSLVVETVFAWPGIGQLTVASVARRDDPGLLVITVVTGLIVVVANFLTDLAYPWLDPRVDYE